MKIGGWNATLADQVLGANGKVSQYADRRLRHMLICLRCVRARRKTSWKLGKAYSSCGTTGAQAH